MTNINFALILPQKDENLERGGPEIVFLKTLKSIDHQYIGSRVNFRILCFSST